MNVEIKKLTPSILDDYLHFFDNVGFSDHKEWSLCYCMFFHMTEEMEKLYEATHEVKNRDYAAQYVEDGRMNGYLAYAEGEIAGWLNIDDKGAYNMLSKENRPQLWDDESDGLRIKSSVCFLIAPQMRGKGIAAKLLERACSDAAEEGYDWIEAYPIKDKGGCFKQYHGPAGLYEKFGFSLYKELDDDYIFRKKL